MAASIQDIYKQVRKHLSPALAVQTVHDHTHYVQPLDVTERMFMTNYSYNSLVLLNFDPKTDPTQFRRNIWNKICDNKSLTFTTCIKKKPGVDKTNLSAIYQRNRRFPFWLSPRGNGLDSHRTWEALYLDVIPIVWHSTLDSLYKDLPVLIVNSWTDLNETFLRKQLYKIASKKREKPCRYQYLKLRNAYWVHLILKRSRYAFNETVFRKNRCWRGKTTVTTTFTMLNS